MTIKAQEVTVTLTHEELDAIIGWAGMAAVGFEFGPPTPDVQESPSVTALRKLETARGG